MVEVSIPLTTLLKLPPSYEGGYFKGILREGVLRYRVAHKSYEASNAHSDHPNSEYIVIVLGRIFNIFWIRRKERVFIGPG